jgi:hypothetical protein
MNASGKRVLIEDPYNQPEIGTAMEFRLTYAGPLFATQRDDRPGQKSRHTENKHQIRTTFHKQLKELWRVTPGLAPVSRHRPSILVMQGNSQRPLTDIGPLAARYALYGFNFVPLVTQELDLLCGLEILFLRPDRPGSAIWAGDIDNRLKTLLDALRIPEPSEDYAKRTPLQEEKPFFCLLEEDKLITKVSVETDRLLEPLNAVIKPHDARLVITVRVRPYEVHVDNLHFG